MKKIKKLCILSTLLLAITSSVSCTTKNSDTTTFVTPPMFNIATPSAGEEQTPMPDEEVSYPTAEPGTPNVISLYVNNSGTRTIVDQVYASAWAPDATIKCFEALTTTEKTMYADWFGDLWYDKWDDFTNHEKTRIGYFVTIKLKTGDVFEFDVKNSLNTNQYTQYLETYLYDDYHAIKGQRYSHLTPEITNDDTIATSIKFVCGKNISEVSEMSLKAYLYTTDYPDRIIAENSILVKNSNV